MNEKEVGIRQRTVVQGTRPGEWSEKPLKGWRTVKSWKLRENISLGKILYVSNRASRERTETNPVRQQRG